MNMPTENMVSLPSACISKCIDARTNFGIGWGQTINRVPLPDRQIYSLYDYRARHVSTSCSFNYLNPLISSFTLGNIQNRSRPTSIA